MFAWSKNDLNPEQVAAIAEEHSVFLVACPGSGKTRTLTYKIADQLSKLESDKEWVIAITYTHRAADEIHERVAGLGVDTSKLWIGTIHSFCLDWILKPYAIYHDALKSGFKVINSHDSERMLTELCRPFRYPNISYWDCGHYYTSAGRVLASRQQNKLPSVSKALDQYHASLVENRQVDFELILRYAHELVASNPSISILLGSIFSYILVDEFQDTKEIQYAIIAAILKAGKGKVRTFIVGDPNQAIYDSLGGYAITANEIRKLAGIELKELELSENYRSSSRIVSYFDSYKVFPSKIDAVGKNRDYPSLISFNSTIERGDLIEELVRLIKYNVETIGVLPREVCIVAPWWMHLASMTRKLVAALPTYSFDGPGLVPFGRDLDNFWYKLSRIVLTEASPQMYMRRLRWAGEILSALQDAGIDTSNLSKKLLLRECNSVSVLEDDGLKFLARFFDDLFARLGIDFRVVPVLVEHHAAFFESSKERIDKLAKEGAEFIGDIGSFRNVFENRFGITVSTIHGVKGAEYDSVIAYALLEGMVPHFADPNGEDSAKKLLYVVSSRARRNLHLISERGRIDGKGNEYQPTDVLRECVFTYDIVP